MLVFSTVEDERRLEELSKKLNRQRRENKDISKTIRNILEIRTTLKTTNNLLLEIKSNEIIGEDKETFGVYLKHKI